MEVNQNMFEQIFTPENSNSTDGLEDFIVELKFPFKCNVIVTSAINLDTKQIRTIINMHDLKYNGIHPFPYYIEGHTDQFTISSAYLPEKIPLYYPGMMENKFDKVDLKKEIMLGVNPMLAISNNRQIDYTQDIWVTVPSALKKVMVNLENGGNIFVDTRNVRVYNLKTTDGNIYFKQRYIYDISELTAETSKGTIVVQNSNTLSNLTSLKGDIFIDNGKLQKGSRIIADSGYIYCSAESPTDEDRLWTTAVKNNQEMINVNTNEGLNVKTKINTVQASMIKDYKEKQEKIQAAKQFIKTI